MTTFFVLNPYSRGGDVDTQAIVETLARLGPVAAFNVAEDDGLESRLVAIGAALKRIVVAGGDGTLNKLLPNVLHAAGIGLRPEVTADGELVDMTPLSCRILPRALKVIAQ